MISKIHEHPLASWLGHDRLGGEVLSSLTIIFRTSGCSWNQCLMCSYCHERHYQAASPASYQDLLLSQLKRVEETYKQEQYELVKLFTSGSVLDPKEIPLPVLIRILKVFRGKIIIAETRPEYVQDDTLESVIAEIDTGRWNTPFYCAIGLETSSDYIRDKSIRKGFAFSDFSAACSRAKNVGADIKAYLLHKPLFLTEREALDDMISSIQATARYADLISMNPCTVQRHTELERYWRQRAYRPPYLWSVLSVLLNSPVHVTCDPVGGGRIRGPHNCGACDMDIVKGIRDYSLNGDRELISALLEKECACKEEWQHVLDHEMPSGMPLTR